MSSGVLRLTHLLKRIDEDELRHYGKHHGWRGLDCDYAKTLARDLFYTSVTRTNAPNEDIMWQSDFAVC